MNSQEQQQHSKSQDVGKDTRAPNNSLFVLNNFSNF